MWELESVRRRKGAQVADAGPLEAARQIERMRLLALLTRGELDPAGTLAPRLLLGGPEQRLTDPSAPARRIDDELGDPADNEVGVQARHDVGREEAEEVGRARGRRHLQPRGRVAGEAFDVGARLVGARRIAEQPEQARHLARVARFGVPDRKAHRDIVAHLRGGSGRNA